VGSFGGLLIDNGRPMAKTRLAAPHQDGQAVAPLREEEERPPPSLRDTSPGGPGEERRHYCAEDGE